MFFQEAYGKPDPENVAKVKAIYKELDLQVWKLHFVKRKNITRKR